MVYTDIQTYSQITCGSIVGAVLILGIFVNVTLMVLFSLKSQPQLIPTNLLLWNLAFSNCTLCFFVLPTVLAGIISPRITYQGVFCDIVGVFSQLWWISNILTLMFLSYDKYKFISCPLIYKTVITRAKAFTYIAIIWTSAIIFSFIPIFGWSRYQYNNVQFTCAIDWHKNMPLMVFYTVATFWIPCVVVIYCYSCIVWNAQDNYNWIGTLILSTHSRQLNSRRKSMFKTAKTSFIVVAIFIMAWVPHYALIITYSFYKNFQLENNLKFLCVVVYLPVFIYPYLFAFRNHTLRRELRIMYDRFRMCFEDVRKIHPASTVVETDYPGNVSRRNSRTESNISQRNSQTELIVSRRNSRNESNVTLENLHKDVSQNNSVIELTGSKQNRQTNQRHSRTASDGKINKECCGNVQSVYVSRQKSAPTSTISRQISVDSGLPNVGI